MDFSGILNVWNNAYGNTYGNYYSSLYGNYYNNIYGSSYNNYYGGISGSTGFLEMLTAMMAHMAAGDADNEAKINDFFNNVIKKESAFVKNTSKSKTLSETTGKKSVSRQSESFNQTVEAAKKQQQEMVSAYKKNVMQKAEVIQRSKFL